MLALGLAGKLTSFTVDLDALEKTADYVVETIRTNYPDLKIPFHARWRHFTFGGRDLWGKLAAGIGDRDERSRAGFDLAIISVLLDAGAGMAWRFREPATGETSRSEGLALASLRMFESGIFSLHPGNRYRADASKLKAITPKDVARAFQVSEANPLVGVEGRAALLNALGAAVEALPGARPGGLFDLLKKQSLATVKSTLEVPGATDVRGGKGRQVRRERQNSLDAFMQGQGAVISTSPTLGATAILEAVLTYLGPIWPSRISLGGVPLGDTWKHPLIGGTGETAGLVPFHKLSQWLSYSLIEPMQWAGVTVTGIDGLTGLPEYRNGGLFTDMGVITLIDPAMADADNTVDSSLVVEWRALTVALLDRIAPMIRARLGLAEADFPLARVLEGGTWAAGRRIAKSLRDDGGPPIRVVSDGTVF